jgi:hypothetical protein
MSRPVLTLLLVQGEFAVCRLDPGAPIPTWATTGTIWSITRTADELSIVCDDAVVPNDVQCEHGWRMLQVVGPLDFALTGILASVASPLAAAGVSIFALSTFDTDYVLVRQHAVELAITALVEAGHHIVRYNG